MSRRRPGTCREPGPGPAHCTDEAGAGHRYSCYDAGEDVSWNDRSPEDWQTETPHDCRDPECPDNPKPQQISDRAAEAILGLVDTDRHLREPVEDLQRWERRVPGSDVAIEAITVATGDGDGTARLPESVLAQLLVEAGWERTA